MPSRFARGTRRGKLRPMTFPFCPRSPAVSRLSLFLFAAFLTACANAENDWPFQTETVATLNEPWAMAVLPDASLLVTEKRGRLLIVRENGEQVAQVWSQATDPPASLTV